MSDLQFKASKFSERQREQQLEKEREEKRIAKLMKRHPEKGDVISALVLAG